MNTRPGVVVHLDEADPDKHSAVLRNIANLRAELGPDVPVELVVHGPALPLLLRDGPGAGQVTQLIADGLLAAACRNSLRSLGLDPSALLPGVEVVPAGVAELARRQFDGWAYLRP